MYIKKGKTNQTADNSEQQEVANKFVLDLPLPQLLLLFLLFVLSLNFVSPPLVS